ncbi:MAG: thymidine phosphorylase family protein [Flavobacteriales bacterium]|nr:thymidine phosphorylase family protein [Flavobacteriales bacterium]MCB9447990.1 thymidine phosphorylase family protein [Flavobacteriales bacterium]
MKNGKQLLTYRHLGIETQHEHIVFMRKDCHVCVSEGFEALSRVRVFKGGKHIIANLNVVTENHILEQGEVGLSNSARIALGAKEGDHIRVMHLSPIQSLAYMRAKIFGEELNEDQFTGIITDMVAGRYANVHISAFVTACAGQRMTAAEMTALTRVMINTGRRLSWNASVVADKHCVGGLPGNRTTPIVVAIAAANGLIIPKTSSRAITSPAGTADTMEVITPVNLTSRRLKEVIRKEGGCLAWGESAHLSPADDILIRVERALDIDSEGQMIASVLSKKAAAGSTHVVIDIPVGPTAKVRSEQDAERLKYLFKVVARDIGLKVKVLITDGMQPVGRGIGPALEAMDVLSVLRCEAGAPADLRERALLLAGNLFELTGKAGVGKGYAMARQCIDSGEALKKFMAICRAQGGFTEPAMAHYHKDVKAPVSGTVQDIDNRKLAKLAKLAGAPDDAEAGVELHTPLGTKVKKGDVLFTVYSNSKGELQYALNYLKQQDGAYIVRVTGK